MKANYNFKQRLNQRDAERGAAGELISNDESNNIDLEQRRYEMALDCIKYNGFHSKREEIAGDVKKAIAYADELIKQLKS